MRITIALGACALALAAACGTDSAPDGLPTPDLAAQFSGEALVRARLADLDAAVRRSPSDGSAWGRLGESYDVHGLAAEAASCYARAGELDAGEWLWPYHRAVLVRRSDLTSALASFQRAAALRDDYAPLAFYLGLAHLLNGDDSAAEEHFARARELDPALVNARLGLARTALARGDAAAALEELREAEALAPDEAAVHRHLAQAWREAGETERAAAADRRAESARVPARGSGFSEMPDPVRTELGRRVGATIDWLARRSAAYEAADRREEALAIWEELLLVDSGSTRAIVETSRLLAATGRVDDGFARIDAALERSPDDARLRAGRGNLLLRSGKPREALDELRRAHALDRDDPQIMNNLAGVLLASGAVEDGMALLRRAAESAPENADAQFNLAMALSRIGQPAEAQQVARRALEVSPEHFPARRLLATIKASAGDRVGAANELELALRARPTDAALRNELALLWKEQGRHADAITLLRQGLESGAGSVELRRELAWTLATAPRPELRNGSEALVLARALCDATRGNHPQDLDILAAAQAETGDFAAARESETRSIGIVENALARSEPGSAGASKTAALLEDLRARLRLYEAGTAYHE